MSDVWLSEEALAKTMPAERREGASPIPSQVVSNGEYLPWAQTESQRRVEHEVAALADRYGRALGMSRRRFLRTSCGMAAAFLAMNRVFGPLFAVSPREAADPAAAGERLAALRRQFVFDVQTHFIRDDFAWDGILALGDYAKRWNPVLREEGVTLRRYKLENYLKEIFLDSDTTLALASSAPADEPAHTIVDETDMTRARALVNGIAGTRRMYATAC